jgi:hypothetical protein
MQTVDLRAEGTRVAAVVDQIVCASAADGSVDLTGHDGADVAFGESAAPHDALHLDRFGHIDDQHAIDEGVLAGL